MVDGTCARHDGLGLQEAAHRGADPCHQFGRREWLGNVVGGMRCARYRPAWRPTPQGRSSSRPRSSMTARWMPLVLEQEPDFMWRKQMYRLWPRIAKGLLHTPHLGRPESRSWGRLVLLRRWACASLTEEIGYCKLSLDRPVELDIVTGRRADVFSLADRHIGGEPGTGAIEFTLRRAANVVRQELKIDKAARSRAPG